MIIDIIVSIIIVIGFIFYFFIQIFITKKCVEILLEKGANAYLKDKNGEMAEDVTTDNSIRLLLQNSTDKFFSEINEINKKKEKKMKIIKLI